MDTLDLKSNIKRGMLLSAGLFLLGKKKLDEVIANLEENGMNKEEAERVAHEVLHSAREHKEELINRISSEIEKRNIFATKEDVAKVQKSLKEISKKLED